MNNTNEILERILLNMKYDSKKTLSENKKTIIKEDRIKECMNFLYMSQELYDALIIIATSYSKCSDPFWCNRHNGSGDCYFMVNITPKNQTLSHYPSDEFPANEFVVCKEGYTGCKSKKEWINTKPTKSVPQEALNWLRKMYSMIEDNVLPVRVSSQSATYINISPQELNKNNIQVILGENDIKELKEKFVRILGDSDKNQLGGLPRAYDDKSIEWTIGNLSDEEVAFILTELLEKPVDKYLSAKRKQSSGGGTGDTPSGVDIEGESNREARIKLEIRNDVLNDYVKKENLKLDDVKKEFGAKETEKDLQLLANAWNSGWRPGKEIEPKFWTETHAKQYMLNLKKDSNPDLDKTKDGRTLLFLTGGK